MAEHEEIGDVHTPFVIGIGGGTASGKTTVCRKIIERLQLPRVVVISTDSFYKPLTKDQRSNVNSYNFDHPDAFDWNLLRDTIAQLKACKAVEIPIYDFVTHSRIEDTERLVAADVIVLEGILAFYRRDIREMIDLRVFIDTDSDLRLARRIRRDIQERGRTLESVLHQYQITVKPSFDNFCAPTKRHCHIIIPNGRHNPVAIDLLTEHVRTQLIKRGLSDDLRTAYVSPRPQLNGAVNGVASRARAASPALVIDSHRPIGVSPSPSCEDLSGALDAVPLQR